MTVGFTPLFTASDGNKVFFPASPNLYDEREVCEKVITEFTPLWGMVGLSDPEVFEFEHDDGKFIMPHVACTHPIMGDGCVISGPAFDEAVAANGGTTVAPEIEDAEVVDGAEVVDEFATDKPEAG
jgi:hypothetical protein